MEAALTMVAEPRVKIRADSMEAAKKVEHRTPLLEQLDRNLDYAREVAFGGVMKDTNIPDYRRFSPFVDYNVGDNLKLQQFADLAVKDLFKAGAELEKAETQEKLSKLKPYSEEARALQIPGPKEIAYDYILGNRTREDSATIAAGVLSEYVKTATDKRDEFIEMKRRHFAKSNPTRLEENELDMLITGAGDHVRRATAHIKEQYKIPNDEVEGSVQIHNLELKRNDPLHAKEWALPSNNPR